MEAPPYKNIKIMKNFFLRGAKVLFIFIGGDVGWSDICSTSLWYFGKPIHISYNRIFYLIGKRDVYVGLDRIELFLQQLVFT